MKDRNTKPAPAFISVRPTSAVSELLEVVREATGQKTSTIVNDVLEEFLPVLLRRRSEKLQAALEKFEGGSAKQLAKKVARKGLKSR